ncbi:DUF3169 family protein [Streptococcus sp. DD13]|uniref:DUF3169 family protein n=1 Tax=Streptococcus sp. DD13 TaxID=1777881 RepID=UPI0007942A8E|nr:DUF3169 family protein [Streptococcus sp. DD13]KXT79271.1 hypothetical protein STRDD13_00095 [Streptococcus sp. DD13]
MRKRKKTQRYRFWRNVLIIGLSGLCGVLIGYGVKVFHLERGVRLTNILSQPLLYGGLTTLSVFLLLVAGYLYRKLKENVALRSQTEDEELANAIEIRSQKESSLLFMIAAVLIVPALLVFNYMIGTVYRYEADGVLANLYGVIVFLSGVATSILADRSYKVVNGRALPRYANSKEKREVLMSHMDEVEKQINYEENFELVIRLTNQVIPAILILLLILSALFRMDITLAMVTVGCIYIYMIIHQYRIVKRYYK